MGFKLFTLFFLLSVIVGLWTKSFFTGLVIFLGYVITKIVYNIFTS
jgi:hypothetical protein